MHRVSGIIQVEQHTCRHTSPFPFAQVQLAQGHRQPIAAPAIDRILQTGEAGLAGQGGATDRQPATHLFEQRIVAQGCRIILVIVATGNLVEPLLDERL